MNCDVYRISVGSPKDVTSVCPSVSSPYQFLGKRMLYGDGSGTHLRDLTTDETITVATDAGWSGGANGNGVFYVKGELGRLELWVDDIQSGKTVDLLPVQCASVYFIDGDLCLVDPVDSLNIQRVVLDALRPISQSSHSPAML